jgi:alanine racemase
MPRLADVLRKSGLKPAGLFTHFAAAKDPDDRVSTQRQIAAFSTMADRIGDAIHDGVIRHASASGGTLLFPEAHLDMVRVGMGLYGYWPSRESRKAEQKLTIALKPVLSWKSVVAETKQISKGSRVGYDGVERVRRATRMAVVPVGYWHGYDRGFSKKGVMLVRGRRARVLGRVSMDMTVIDITGIPGVCTGDEVVLIGADGGESIYADELAGMIGTTAYEFLTRINPLIRRVGV